MLQCIFFAFIDMLTCFITAFFQAIEMMGYSESEILWSLGVLNVFFSSWLAGAFPWTYWIVHFWKMLYLLVVRVRRFSLDKKIFFLCDFCYMVNYALFVWYILCVALRESGDMETISYYAFRCFFTMSVGPLCMSIAAFRNSLVFHSLDQITILALHWSPNVAMWGMRWWLNDLESTFPNTFYIGCGEPDAPWQFTLFFSESDTCAGNFVELWCIPVLAYIACYSIPYSFFFF